MAAITRACYARGVGAAEWIRLVRQGGDDLEQEVGATLASLVCGTSIAQPACLELVRAALEGRVVRPDPFVSFLLHASPPTSRILGDDSGLNAALAIVNDALRTAPRSAHLRIVDACPLAAALDFLASSLATTSSCHAPLHLYTYLESFLACFVDDMGTLSPEGSLALSAQISGVLALLSDRAMEATAGIEASLMMLRGRMQTVSPLHPVEVEQEVHSTGRNFSNAQFLVQDLYCSAASGVGAGSYDVASARVLAALRIVLRDQSCGDCATTPADFLLDILLAASRPLRLGQPTAAMTAFAYSRVPELLRDLISISSRDPSLDVPDGILLSSLNDAVVSLKALTCPSFDRESTEEDARSRYIFSGILGGLHSCHLALVVESPGLVPPMQTDVLATFQSNPDVGALTPFLDVILTGQHHDNRSLSSAVEYAVRTWCSSMELYQLASLCTSLQRPGLLEALFLYIEPVALLGPLQVFLESFDFDGSSVESHPIEAYGTVILFLQVVISRFDLGDELTFHLGTDRGSIRALLPSLSSARFLDGLDELTTSTIRGWIAALFGEGISDELMQSTKPSVLVAIAPTIYTQALFACKSGIIDYDTLRDGLSYFLQSLLNWTLPGVLRFLAAAIIRTPPSPEHTVMLDLLFLCVLAPLPPAVLELARDALHELAAHLSASQAPPADLSKLEQLLHQIGPVPNSAASTWKADLLTVFEHQGELDLASSLRRTRKELSELEMVDQLAVQLLASAAGSSVASRRTLRIRRIGASLLATFDARSGCSWPLLASFVHHSLPQLRNTLDRLDAHDVEHACRGRALLDGLARMAVADARELQKTLKPEEDSEQLRALIASLDNRDGRSTIPHAHGLTNALDLALGSAIDLTA